jgi:hypothetical protein
MVARAGAEAGFTFRVQPHMPRHACGFALANGGHDRRALQAYLGHKNIQRAVRYTELSPTRFKNFWRVGVCNQVGKMNGYEIADMLAVIQSALLAKNNPKLGETIGHASNALRAIREYNEQTEVRE